MLAQQDLATARRCSSPCCGRGRSTARTGSARRRRARRSRPACWRPGRASRSPCSRPCRSPARRARPRPAARTASGGRAPIADAGWPRAGARRSRGASAGSWLAPVPVAARCARRRCRRTRTPRARARRSLATGVPGAAARPRTDERGGDRGFALDRVRSSAADEVARGRGRCAHARARRRLRATYRLAGRARILAGSTRDRPEPSRCSRRGRAAGTARSRCTTRAAPCACASPRRRWRRRDRRRCTACSRCTAPRRCGRRSAGRARRESGRARWPASGQRRERRDQGVPAGRAAIDRRAAGDGLGVRPARRRSRSAGTASAGARRRCGRRGTAREAMLTPRILEHWIAGGRRSRRGSARRVARSRDAQSRSARRTRALRADACRIATLRSPRVRSARIAPAPVLERPLARGFAPWLGATLLRLAGWKVVLAQPVPARCVVIFYPHTSNWDTAIGLCVKFMIGIAHPLRRQGHAVHACRCWDRCSCAGAEFPSTGASGPASSTQMTARVPAHTTTSGWRSRRKARAAAPPHWKSGFYHLARAAGVPLALGFIDYPRREVGVGRLPRPDRRRGGRHGAHSRVLRGQARPASARTRARSACATSAPAVRLTRPCTRPHAARIRAMRTTHAHRHAPAARATRRALWTALLLTGGFAAVEAVGRLPRRIARADLRRRPHGRPTRRRSSSR